MTGKIIWEQDVKHMELQAIQNLPDTRPHTFRLNKIWCRRHAPGAHQKAQFQNLCLKKIYFNTKPLEVLKGTFHPPNFWPKINETKTGKQRTINQQFKKHSRNPEKTQTLCTKKIRRLLQLLIEVLGQQGLPIHLRSSKGLDLDMAETRVLAPNPKMQILVMVIVCKVCIQAWFNHSRKDKVSTKIWVHKCKICSTNFAREMNTLHIAHLRQSSSKTSFKGTAGSCWVVLI